jgi:hypothetical protein
VRTSNALDEVMIYFVAAWPPGCYLLMKMFTEGPILDFHIDKTSRVTALTSNGAKLNRVAFSWRVVTFRAP